MELFLFWLESVLLPVLRPGQVVIMDNASFHKSFRVAELIEGASCRLVYLPPYSPDLNPIEKYWAWLKRKVRDLQSSVSDFYTRLELACKSEYRTTLN